MVVNHSCTCIYNSKLWAVYHSRLCIHHYSKLWVVYHSCICIYHFSITTANYGQFIIHVCGSFNTQAAPNNFKYVYIIILCLLSFVQYKISTSQICIETQFYFVQLGKTTNLTKYMDSLDSFLHKTRCSLLHLESTCMYFLILVCTNSSCMCTVMCPST